MDYKAFFKELEQIKKELINYTNSKTKKNITRVEKLVNEYLENMKQEKYSLKSYKAKIIHNELEHHRTKKELVQVDSNVCQHIDSLLEEYFNEYLQIEESEKSSPTKLKDLKDFSLAHRKQRQEIVNKKNSLERDLAQRNKEFEQAKEEKQRVYTETILEIKSRLHTALGKIEEKTVKEYSEFERQLIDTNDLDEIAKLKEKIKAIRYQGLSEEYNAKAQTYDILMTEELAFIESFETFLFDVNNYNNTNQRKIIDLEKDLNELTLELESKEKAYDTETEIKYIGEWEKEIDTFVELLENHNSFIDSYNKNDKKENENLTIEEKLFSFDIIVLNLYYLLITIRKNNLYDSLGQIIHDLINLVYTVKNATIELENNMVKLHQEQTEKLVVGLTDYVPKNPRRVSKEEFIENVKNSLTRYYNNFFDEIDLFNLVIYKMFAKFVKDIRIKRNDLMANNNKINLLSTRYVYKNESYNYVNLEEWFEEENHLVLNSTGEYVQATNEDKDLEIKTMQEKLKFPNKEKLVKLQSALVSFTEEYKRAKDSLIADYNNKVLINKNESLKINEKYLQAKKEKENKLKKSTKENISNAKKLYFKSIKAL